MTIKRLRIYLLLLFAFHFFFLNRNCQSQVLVQDSLYLVDLYNMTDGDFWYNNTNWKTSAPVGQWYGIVVEENRISGIDLRENNLNGFIPNAINLLDSLELLALGGEDDFFINELPINTALLTRLDTLMVSNCGFSRLPPFHLFPNQISFLDISRNEFDEIGESIYGLADLRHLNGTENSIDTIPSAFFETQAELEYLNLSKNELGGEFPDEIFDFVLLKHLDLGYNAFQGSISENIQNLVNLEVLALDALERMDDFNFSSISNLVSLRELTLSHCGIIGTFPNGIGNLTNLEVLALDNNWFFDALPQQLALEHLQEIYLDSNLFTGSVPEWLGSNRLLRIIHLERNNFSGAIPSGFEQMEGLERVFLHNNTFLADLPDLNRGGTLQQAKMEGNSFTFGDIAPNSGGAIQATYAPQSGWGNQYDTLVAMGSSLQLDATIPCDGGPCADLFNVYDWHKDGALLVSGTSGAIELENIQPSDSGVYTCGISNFAVPGLIIRRRPIRVSVSTITDMENQFSRKRMESAVFPNPSNTGKFNLTTDYPMAGVQSIRLFNVIGKEVTDATKIWEERVSNFYNIDLGNLPKGIYYIHFDVNAKSNLLKMIYF